MAWETAKQEAIGRFRAKPVQERARRLSEAEKVIEEAVAIYRETGDARAADYHIAFCTLRRRLGREPSEAEVLNELGRM